MAVAGGGISARGVMWKDGHLIWMGNACNKHVSVVERDMEKASSFLVNNPGRSIQVEQGGTKSWDLATLVREKSDGAGKQSPL